MRRVLMCGLGLSAACASESRSPIAKEGRATEVTVSVDGWDGGRVGAALIDRFGRRTGWGLNDVRDEIPGCVRESGSESGIPNPRPDVADTSAVAEWERVQADTLPDPVPGDPATTPLYHYFRISNDAATKVGLIDEGECDLALEPAVAGRVRLSLVANMGRPGSCRDSVSSAVTLGAPSRWRLRWSVVGDQCLVKIARLPAIAPSARRR